MITTGGKIMSSIEADIRHFFFDRMVPTAKQLRACNVSFFPQGREKETGSDSWYIPYPADTLDIVKLETAVIGPELARMWADHPELTGLVGPLMELAQRIAAQNTKDEVQHDEDISPYMYVMF
jgi:hypothetical protein